uniref:Uncharacterized protein n=1 Tax=Clastoptera arizonana TaxID=38151 RepID=A0A1B6DQ19_9HEMI
MTEDIDNNQWSMKDKLSQYRSITHLQQRTIAHSKDVMNNLRKKQETKIKDLIKQNNKYRENYGLSIYGDRKKLVPVLQNHPILQLAYQNKIPKDIEENLKQVAFSKKKQLHRQCYKNKQREDDFLNIKLELEELQTASTTSKDHMWEEQQLTYEIQQVKSKLNAASIINESSLNMINVLEKDTICYNRILEELETDSKKQYHCILKAAKLGQEAADELSKLHKEYDIIVKTVKKNMKEKNRAIHNIKKKYEKVRAHNSHIPKVKSHEVSQSVDADNRDSGGEVNFQESEVILPVMERTITRLTGILKELQNISLVPSFEDIFPRALEQLKNKVRLQRQVVINEEQKTTILDQRNTLDVLLEVAIYHTLKAAVTFKNNQDHTEHKIEEEKKVIQGYKKKNHYQNEHILHIRTALITFNILLSKFYPIQDELILNVSAESEDKLFAESEFAVKPLLQPKSDAVSVLGMVNEKIKWVLDQISKKKMDPSKPKTLLKRRVTYDSILKDVLEDESDTSKNCLLFTFHNLPCGII